MYCIAEDVQRMIRWITFGVDTVVSEEDIEEIIAEVDAVIDSRIHHLYQTPITDDVDVRIVQYASVRMAAYEVAKIIVSQAGGQLPQIVQTWHQESEERIQDIVARRLHLINTPLQKQGSSSLWSHVTDNPDAPERVWKLDKEQW